MRPVPGGSGALARECATLYPDATVTVFDIPEVVRAARAHFPFPEGARICFQEGEVRVQAWGLPPRSRCPPSFPSTLVTTELDSGAALRSSRDPSRPSFPPVATVALVASSGLADAIREDETRRDGIPEEAEAGGSPAASCFGGKL